MPNLLVAAPPLSKNHATARRQRAEMQRAVGAIERLFVLLNPAAVAAAAAAAAAGAEAGAAIDAERARIEHLLVGRTFTPAERAQIRAETEARAFGFRRALLADALTAPEVGRRLGVSRQTPHDRARSGVFLAVQDRGAWRFPTWQFDPDGDDGVVARFPEVLRALDRLSNLAKASWLATPNPVLDGRRPIDALRTDPDRVIDQAMGVRAAA
jgi:hypothetical protein